MWKDFVTAAPIPRDNMELGLNLSWLQIVGFGELANSEVADIPVKL